MAVKRRYGKVATHGNWWDANIGIARVTRPARLGRWWNGCWGRRYRGSGGRNRRRGWLWGMRCRWLRRRSRLRGIGCGWRFSLGRRRFRCLGRVGPLSGRTRRSATVGVASSSATPPQPASYRTHTINSQRRDRHPSGHPPASAWLPARSWSNTINQFQQRR